MGWWRTARKNPRDEPCRARLANGQVQWASNCRSSRLLSYFGADDHLRGNETTRNATTGGSSMRSSTIPTNGRASLTKTRSRRWVPKAVEGNRARGPRPVIQFTRKATEDTDLAGQKRFVRVDEVAPVLSFGESRRKCVRPRQINSILAAIPNQTHRPSASGNIFCLGAKPSPPPRAAGDVSGPIGGTCRCGSS